jgi:hypothetical protein
MDQELRVFRRFAQARQHTEGLTVETRRHFDGVAESLGSHIRLVAEGHTALAWQLDEHRRERDASLQEVVSAMTLPYAELDRRITRPEAVSADLEGRLARREARR